MKETETTWEEWRRIGETRLMDLPPKLREYVLSGRWYQDRLDVYFLQKRWKRAGREDEAPDNERSGLTATAGQPVEDALTSPEPRTEVMR